MLTAFNVTLHLCTKLSRDAQNIVAKAVAAVLEQMSSEQLADAVLHDDVSPWAGSAPTPCGAVPYVDALLRTHAWFTTSRMFKCLAVFGV